MTATWRVKEAFLDQTMLIGQLYLFREHEHAPTTSPATSYVSDSYIREENGRQIILYLCNNGKNIPFYVVTDNDSISLFPIQIDMSASKSYKSGQDG